MPNVMYPLTSSNVHSVGYDDDNKQLRVAFNSGSEYVFGTSKETGEPISRTIMIDMLDTHSAGKFFNQHVKDKYTSRKLEPHEYWPEV